VTRPWQFRQAVRLAQMVLDLMVLAAAFYLAYVLRFEGTRTDFFPFAWLVPAVVLVQYVFLIGCMVPSSSWQYVSLLEVRRIGTALTGATLLLFTLVTATDRIGGIPPALAKSIPPRALLILDLALGLIGLIGMRASVRLWMEQAKRDPRRTRGIPLVPTLLIGAGSAGAATARQITADPKLGMEPVGFLDDDPNKRGLLIHGIRVLGTVAEVKKIAQTTGAKQGIITIGNPSREALHRIVDQCTKSGVVTKVIPGIRRILESKVNLSAIREVAIEDLLCREPIHLDFESIAAFINGRRILITGAGGSIGSELCRIVCRFGPTRLVLVEHTENNLFHIHRELAGDTSGVEIVPCLADICDQQRMEQIFGGQRPDMVLHAAAYKHVPMIEWNPGEAIKNNVMGTRLIAQLSHRHGVREFVMISTDKAVNPTSIMGASKRVAEIYIQALAQRSQTRFVNVRFGNVLGSAGSVIPTFKEQIARGGPVTVTHPDMRRYFMTIPEACQLVLQAATMGRGGEIFILDMGKPVKIVDLARNLIALSGFGPEEIPIQFTGMRPGEKLFEELALQDEFAQKTRHPKIFIGRLQPASLVDIDSAIEEMQALADSSDTNAILRKLKQIVPEFDCGLLNEPHHPAWTGSPALSVNGKSPSNGIEKRNKASLLLLGETIASPAGDLPTGAPRPHRNGKPLPPG
jgi:FlaA1/EpsC-like NDP-sugar epimerase